MARRGAAMLELSLAIVPFLAITLAIIDFSMPIFLRTMLTNAVREGSRFAITYQTRGGQTHSESVKDVVVANSLGFLSGSAGRNKVKVRFFSPTVFTEETGANRNAGGNVVEVSVEGFTWQYMVPLWRSSEPVNIHATSSDRLEILPKSVTRPAP
jgi:Flp pilus assembly protein TadG